MSQGTLEVSIIAGRELKNKDGLFGSNDPYTLVRLGHQKFKTEVKTKAGSECQWNQTFHLGVTENMKDLILEVYDQDRMMDDLIGKTTIPLQGILQNGYADAWYTIGKGSKSHGEIHALIKFRQGAFPDGFDPNASNMDDNLKMAGTVLGGAAAVGVAGLGAKMLYDHYQKGKNEEQDKPLNQGSGQQGYGGNQGGQQGYGSNQQGHGNNQSGYGGQGNY